MNETHVKVEVELDGQKKLTTHAHITVVQRHDWHHTFEIGLPLADLEGGETGGFTKTKNYVGKVVKISWGDPRENSSETYNQFNGIMTDISVSRHSGSAADVILRGYSPTILLEDGENTRSFSDKTLSNMVGDVTKGKSGLNVNSNPSPDTKYEFMVQYRESNYAFLTRLAVENGKWFYYDGKDLNFGSLQSQGDKIDLKLGNDINHFELGMHTKPMKFSDNIYDYINNQVIKVQSSSIAVNGLDNLGKDLQSKSDNLFNTEELAISYPFVKSQSELKEFSTAKKSAIGAGIVTISGVSYNAKLSIGKKIDITSEDSKDGKTSYGSYIITNITHFTDALGVYQNRFEAISANLTYPPYNAYVHQPICEDQPAKVVKNDDSDGHNRVKVRFYWMKDSESTPWIRVLNQYAGKSKGFLFLPEVDDQVMISFEQNNPSRPYVAGALYHGKANHGDRKDDDNYIKTIRTVSGNEIKFNDKEGEEEITIQNPDGQNEIILSLKDSGKITIKSLNKMELHAKEILIEAEEKLEMKSKDTKLEGENSVAIESQQDLSIKGASGKMETMQDLSISAGTQGELKASAGITIDGGPQTSVKASGMMELNGGGQATLKAGIVMIN